MKLLHITSAYPAYIKSFYGNNPQLEEKSYQEQKTAFFYNSFAWSDSWSEALAKLGYETMEIVYNAGPLQNTWWRENIFSTKLPANPMDIAIEQIKQFSPDILWFDDTSTILLEKIQHSCPKIRFLLGWVGSAMPEISLFSSMDLVLSCANESVEKLRILGIQSEQLHHAFDPRILSRIDTSAPKIHALSFIGQIIRGSQFHDQRADLLEKLCRKIDATIFSSIAELNWKHDAKVMAKKIIHIGNLLLNKISTHEINNEISAPRSQRNAALQSHLKPGVYGLEMYQTLANSDTVLNIHADSSPTHASNMRLFETTGIGSCLLTDWRKNITDLFEPDTEIVTYRNADECIEKAVWLTKHKSEAAKIALAGQKRTLENHTFEHRAVRLAEILKKRL